MTSALTTELRVDHIGSLVRPAKLKDVFARFDRNQAGKEELAEVQDGAIREVIRQQEDHGLPVVTDGEFAAIASRKVFPSA